MCSLLTSARTRRASALLPTQEVEELTPRAEREQRAQPSAATTGAGVHPRANSACVGASGRAGGEAGTPKKGETGVVKKGEMGVVKKGETGAQKNGETGVAQRGAQKGASDRGAEKGASSAERGGEKGGGGVGYCEKDGGGAVRNSMAEADVLQWARSAVDDITEEERRAFSQKLDYYSMLTRGV